MSVESLKGSVAGEIWADIKGKKLDLFGLPDQTVEMHVVPQALIDPESLYVVLKTGAALPQIEEVLGSKYDVELVDRFVVISRA